MSASNTTHLPPHPVSQGCQCDREPFGDPREGTCLRCGRQVKGKPTTTRISAFIKENR